METSHKLGHNFYLNILPPATRRGLNYLTGQSWIKKSKWYLAGGTALALQAGHRQSIDLDFFTPQKKFSSTQLLAHFTDDVWQTDILREGTIYGKLQKAKVSFITYPFFVPKQKFIFYDNIRILHKDDIAVMKIIAISQRGKKRDFIDLYWYCKNVQPLKNFFGNLSEQYPTVSHNYHHILKSLTYFDDADNEPMPKLFFKASWKQIKQFFQNEVKITARRLLKLT